MDQYVGILSEPDKIRLYNISYNFMDDAQSQAEMMWHRMENVCYGFAGGGCIVSDRCEFETRTRYISSLQMCFGNCSSARISLTKRLLPPLLLL